MVATNRGCGERRKPLGSARKARAGRAALAVAAAVLGWLLDGPAGALDGAGQKTLKIDASGRATVGRPAPGVASWDLQDRVVSLASILSTDGTRAVLLAFYASWCKECRPGLQALEAARERLSAAGVRVLLVNSGETKDAAAAFHRKLGLSLAVVLDEFKEITNAYGVVGLPKSFLVGRDGTVLAIYVREGENFVDQVLEDAGVR